MRKVLVADDEPSILRSTELLLEGPDCTVVPVNRADLVVATATRERPDVILQDVRMPGLDLDALVRQLRREPGLAGTRIVLYTAALEGEYLARRLGLPLVEKPCNPADLERALALRSPAARPDALA